jgi:adenosylhomocysteine nucleosidase
MAHAASELVCDDPCVVFALARESGAFRRLFHARKAFPKAPFRAWWCGPPGHSVLAVESGLGAERAQKALTWAFGQAVGRRPRLVVSAGFSGALQPGLSVGDVIVPKEVADLGGNRWPTTWPGELPANRCPPHRGALLSVPNLVSEPGEKRALGGRFSAAAADMETAAVARFCAEQGVPFGCVRAISDDVDTKLSSELIFLLADGTLSPSRLLHALATRPRLVLECSRLARATRRAADRLAGRLGQLLGIPPHGRQARP